MTTNDAVSDIRKHLRDACCQYILLEESYSRNPVGARDGSAPASPGMSRLSWYCLR